MSRLYSQKPCIAKVSNVVVYLSHRSCGCAFRLHLFIKPWYDVIYFRSVKIIKRPTASSNLREVVEFGNQMNSVSYGECSRKTAARRNKDLGLRINKLGSFIYLQELLLKLLLDCK